MAGPYRIARPGLRAVAAPHEAPIRSCGPDRTSVRAEPGVTDALGHRRQARCGTRAVPLRQVRYRIDPGCLAFHCCRLLPRLHLGQGAHLEFAVTAEQPGLKVFD